jgi:hypothetical protein
MFVDDSVKSGTDRRAVLGLLLALGGAGVMGDAVAGAHVGQRRKAGRPVPPEAQGPLYREIEAVLRETEAIWNSQDFGRLKEVWDADDPEPWYVPEEIPEPFYSWPEIERYWNPGRKVLDAFRWEFSNLKVKALADDLTLAIFDHFYEIALGVGPPSAPTAGFDRCLAIFRKTPAGWRHILYAQCPLGPDTYVRALRERIVTPEFQEAADSARRKPK